MSELEKTQDTRTVWLERYQGKTLKQAQTALNALDEFIKANFLGIEEKLVYDMKNDPNPEKKYLILDNMVQYWITTGKGPATIRNYFGFIRSYIRRYGIKTDKTDINEMVKFPVMVTDEAYALERPQIKLILDKSDPKYQAFFLVLATSGMRFGEALLVRKKDLDFTFYKELGLVLVHVRSVTSKERYGRFTFITGQAWEKLKPYYDTELLLDNPVFKISYYAAQDYMSWIRKKLGLNDRYENGFHKITLHSFRSFTRTVLSNKTGPEFAFFLLGQRGYLSRYFRMSPNEAAELYKKAEPNLIVS